MVVTVPRTWLALVVTVPVAAITASASVASPCALAGSRRDHPVERGAASGQPRIPRTLSNGKRSRSNRTDKTVLSGIMGFYDRYVRFPYCRKTAFNDQNPAAFAACLPALQKAAELYRCDFMYGFSLRDSPAFDDWQFFQVASMRRELA